MWDTSSLIYLVGGGISLLSFLNACTEEEEEESSRRPSGRPPVLQSPNAVETSMELRTSGVLVVSVCCLVFLESQRHTISCSDEYLFIDATEKSASPGAKKQSHTH